jgi:hypothetical protein
MLHTNLGGSPIEMTVFNPTNLGGTKAATVEPMTAPCSTTAKLLGLFEEITGWKAEFHESNSSLQCRKSSSSKSEPAQGTFSIVDMSENWPAKKPTSHRAKCDQFIGLLDRFVAEHQSAEVELNRIQSALLALDVTADIEDDDLVDSFVPKFRPLPSPEAESSVSVDTDDDALSDDDFEVHQHVSDTSSSLVCPPFDGWSLGGATGIVGNYYLDWMVDSEERIAICAGEIDANPSVKLESIILVDPLTNEYHVAPTELELSGIDQLQAFKLWDSKTLSLSAINPSSDWHRLKSHQAIVATTAAGLDKLEGWQSACETQNGKAAELQADSSVSMENVSQTSPIKTAAAKPVTANQLAKMLIQTLGTKDPLLVLMRD